MLEVKGQGVLVDFFEVSESDLAFGFGMRGGEGQLHGDDHVVRHAQSVCYQIADGGGDSDDQVERVSLIVCRGIDMLSEI